MIEVSSHCHKNVGTFPQRRHYSSRLNGWFSASYSNKDSLPRAFGESLLTYGLLETARTSIELNTTAAGNQFEKLPSTEQMSGIIIQERNTGWQLN